LSAPQDEKAGPASGFLDRLLDGITAGGLVLVLPVSLLLFLQWPLRDLVQAYSREANDLAQWLFALYVSVAITCTTRLRSHLAADAFARRYKPVTRARLYRFASLIVLLPWSAFVLWAVAPMIWQSLLALERFPETFNPGYFIVKTAVGLLALLVLLQALLDVMRNEERASH
jgi:TRAP-type mannitol/chloroaromatic compound transport system permease small subunit